jgi:CHAD domain-containing protein
VPYQLAPAAPLARELRRVAREQTEAALAQLDGDPDSGRVHDARKRVKKLRSVLRLARDPLGKRVYSQHQRTLRDAGRRLSAIRDADVLVRAAERLQEHVAPNGRDALAALQQRLVLERDSLRTHSLHASVEAGRTMLATLHGGIEEWRLGRVGRQDVLDAFGREYRNGRRAFAAATTSRQDERLHEWRKRVKDLWHLVRLFSNLWPPVFKCWAEETHRLADLLGDDHDLAVLRGALGAAEGKIARGNGALRAAIDARRRQLQQEAIQLGDRIYAEPKRHVQSRMQAYWSASRRQGARAAHRSAAGDSAA